MPLEPINVLSMSRILLLVSVIIVNAKKDIVLRTSEVCYSILRYATASLKYCKQSNAPDAKASSYSPAFFSNIPFKQCDIRLQLLLVIEQLCKHDIPAVPSLPELKNAVQLICGYPQAPVSASAIASCVTYLNSRDDSADSDGKHHWQNKHANCYQIFYNL